MRTAVLCGFYKRRKDQIYAERFHKLKEQVDQAEKVQIYQISYKRFDCPKWQKLPVILKRERIRRVLHDELFVVYIKKVIRW